MQIISKKFKKINVEKLANIFFSIIIVSLCLVQLEYSCRNDISSIFDIHWKYGILNFGTLYMFFIFFFLIINKRILSYVIFEIICVLIAIVNHYVILLHGTPLSATELKNFGTAMNVLGAYSLEIDRTVLILLGSFIILLIVTVLSEFFCKSERVSISNIKKMIIFLILFVMCYMAYFSEYSVKPHKTIGWSWEEAYCKYGFVACSIESIDNALNIVKEPNGYTEKNIKQIQIAEKKIGNNTPDIILIINESFYDLSIIADIETDKNYLENIEKLQNTISGYAVCTGNGGGTNNSEYEILTSNSLQLMPGITPFNVLDMSDANSIVKHLKELGYNTLAAHSEPAVNYMRGKAYPAMGFDTIYFKDDYGDRVNYGERLSETDASEYKKISNWYENMDEGSPRFVYLLTMQNHGPWDINPEEFDIVHVNDMGEQSDEINEYLSCVYLSDKAFLELTSYFEKVNRDVIICMVGDHAPAFASNIIDDKFDENQQKLLLRSTPFVIWANFELESRNEGTISMNYIVPTVLEAAGMKLSPYYQYMLELKAEIPILSSYDQYYDKDGNVYFYGEENEYLEVINQYFNMEYNNLRDKRNQNLFDPY